MPFGINMEQTQRLQMSHICDPISDLIHGSLWTWAQDKADPGSGTHLRGAFVPVDRRWGPMATRAGQIDPGSNPSSTVPRGHDLELRCFRFRPGVYVALHIPPCRRAGPSRRKGGGTQRSVPVHPSVHRSSWRRTGSLLGTAYAHLWAVPKSGARAPKQQHNMARPHTWWQHAHSLAR